MATEIRDTGIDIVGAAPWGTHFCNFYDTTQDLLDTLVPYFKVGLENKEFCLWMVSTSELITVEEAKAALAEVVPDLDRYLAAGQIEVLNALDWYLEDNVFNLERVASAWEARLEQALALGYEGMRVSGDTFWLREHDWKDFCAYEKQVNESISDRPMTLLCTYPLTRSGAALVLDVAKTHQFAIARRQGEWEVIESPELIKARAEIARHKQAEDELRRQKEILQKIFDHIPVMINFVGADGRIKLLNREWERTLGWTLGEIREQNVDVFAECYPDHQYRQQVLKFVTEAKGEWRDFKTRVRDGRVMDQAWVRVRLSDGTSVGIGKDITERKHAEALLHSREQEFRAIVENAPDQIIRYDREFRRTYVNPAVAKFYGLPAETLIGKPIGSGIPETGAKVKEDEVAEVRQRIADVFNTGKTYDYELTWTMPSGCRYFAVRLFPELDLNGSVVNVLGISRDITEHRSAQEELKREKEILEKIFDNIPVMIGFVGDDEVKLVNPEWERTLGWTLKQLKEQNVDIFVEAYPDLSYRQEVLDFVAAATGEWVDLKIKVRDGRVIDAACAVVHLSDGTKVAIAQDITVRKQTEEALDERLRFETLVTELSAAFANLTTNEVDQEIDKWLQRLVEFLGVERASFFQFGEDWTTLFRSHSYTVPGIAPLSPMPLGMKDQFPWITEQLSQGVTVNWSRIPDDIPEEAVNEKEYAARLGVKSGLNIPVQMGGSVICAITFASLRTYRDWPDAMVARLRLVGEIFAAAVERKRAEAALRESEERFRQMAENIREVFWMTTADLSNTLYISPAYEIVWGRSRESLYREPRSFFAAIHPDDQPGVIAIVDRNRDQGFEVEYRVVRPDGSIRWIRDRGFPIADESGRVYRTAGIAADITERKEAEDALRRSEDHLRLVLDTTPALLHAGRPDGYLDYFNQRWLKYVGRSLQELQGWGWTASIHPDDVEGIVSAWRASLASGEPFQYEARVRRAGGEYRWMLHRKVPLRDEHGNIVKWYGSSIDIEDRKQAEEALQRSEEHLRLVIDTIPTMAWTAQPDGVVDFVNQRWLDYAGLTSEQYFKDSTGAVHRDDIQRVSGKWHAAMVAGEPYEDEMRLHQADGEYRWYLVRAEPLHDEQGTIVKWYGVSTDIEDRKQAEEKLKQSETQLAQAQRLAHIGSWDWDLRTNVVTWSDELYHIFGLQAGSISVAGEVDRFIHPDDLDLGWDTVKRAVASKEPYDYYHRILRPDGDERIVHSLGQIVSDDNGNPIRVFGATEDVTELKRGEAKLKATSEQLRALSARLQSAREEEGTRIAREIHDELGSSLTRLKWDLEMMSKEGLGTQDQESLGKSRSRISEMIALVDETVDTVRRISAELRPSALDDLGLGAALRLQSRQFQERTGIITECECSTGGVSLTQQQSTAVFRICEEALTNVMRHSNATRVETKVEMDQGDLVLTISDNGRGIKPADMSDRLSLGLLGMRERVHMIGGEIDIAGIEGKGTVVTARVPISRES